MVYSVQFIAVVMAVVRAVCFGVFISSAASLALELATNCTNQYIPEGGTLTCECTVTSNNTTPLPLSWPGHSNTSVLKVDNVRRDDNGTAFTCLMEGQGIPILYPVCLVLYGPLPESVTIHGPPTFAADGTRNLTLTCDAGDMQPPPAYTWGGLCASSTDTCIFTPQPDQNGEIVVCTVVNTVTINSIPQFYSLDLISPMESAAQDINVILIAGASAGAVILAVSVVAVAVCMCRQKKARLPSKELVQRDQRPESVMYRNSYYISADELLLDSPIPPFYTTPLTAPQEHLPTIHEVELNESGGTTNGSSRKRAHENVTYAVGGCSGAGPAQHLQNGQASAPSTSSMDPEPVYAVVDKSRKKK